MVECRACSLRFLTPQPDDETLARVYAENYSIGSDTSEGRARAAQIKLLTAESYLRVAEGLLGSARGRILEIGCGSGEFLVAAKARSFEVAGLELSPHAANEANRRLGGPFVRTETLENSSFRNERFDLVAGFDVIEHVRDPAAFAAHIHSILTPGGWLLMVTPDLQSWSGRLMGRHWMEYKLEHLFYFNRSTMGRLLSRAGFGEIRFAPNAKCLTLDYINGHFQKFKVPVCSPVLQILRQLTPARLANKPFRIVASGMMVMAQRRKDEARGK